MFNFNFLAQTQENKNGSQEMNGNSLLLPMPKAMPGIHARECAINICDNTDERQSDEAECGARSMRHMI